MGQELECKLHYQGRTLEGKAYLETDHLLFRGGGRLKVPFKDLKSVKAAGGILKLEFAGGPASFELGAAAEKWAHKILHPPSLLDKLGVKPGMAVALAGDFEPDFLRGLREREAAPADPRAKAGLVFFAAQRAADLAQVRKLAARLQPDGGLWVVYPKGVAAIREIDVLEAGRAAGLKDTKVAKFSESHTALKFVIPVSER